MTVRRRIAAAALATAAVAGLEWRAAGALEDLRSAR